jgi:Reverse transcriptase (RNA-dependent DNA polymerase).
MLFKVLKKSGLPSHFTDFLLRLYHAPLDTPRVNGHKLASHLQTRGLRQGCPLSPGLFALYIDPLLHKISRAIQQDSTASLHAFADDLAIHSEHLPALTRALKVMIAEAQPYGLVINMKKSELHAWGDAGQASITFIHNRRRYHLSSMDREGGPTGTTSIWECFSYQLFGQHNERALPIGD